MLHFRNTTVCPFSGDGLFFNTDKKFLFLRKKPILPDITLDNIKQTKVLVIKFLSTAWLKD